MYGVPRIPRIPTNSYNQESLRSENGWKVHETATEAYRRLIVRRQAAFVGDVTYSTLRIVDEFLQTGREFRWKTFGPTCVDQADVEKI